MDNNNFCLNDNETNTSNRIENTFENGINAPTSANSLVKYDQKSNATVETQQIVQNQATITTTSDSERNILDLNDDCLIFIFRYLSRHKQMHMALCCQRFFDIFLKCTPIEYENIYLDLFRTMSECELIDYFKIFRPHAKTLRGHIDLEHIDALVQMKNLELNINRIDVFCYWGVIKYFMDIISSKHMGDVLTTLKINCRVLNDMDMWVICNLPNLMKLSIGMNSEITGRYFENLKQIKLLCLFNCTKIVDFHWIKACEAFTNLQSLDLRGCVSISKHGLGRVLELCVKLEKLRIDCFEPYDLEHYKQIGNLMQLKKLVLVNVTQKTKQLIVELANKSNSSLKLLEINNSSLVTNHKTDDINFDFLYIITRIENLKEVVLIGCTKITDKCLKKLGKFKFLNDLGLFKHRYFIERNLHILIKKLKLDMIDS